MPIALPRAIRGSIGPFISTPDSILLSISTFSVEVVEKTNCSSALAVDKRAVETNVDFEINVDALYLIVIVFYLVVDAIANNNLFEIKRPNYYIVSKIELVVDVVK